MFREKGGYPNPESGHTKAGGYIFNIIFIQLNFAFSDSKRKLSIVIRDEYWLIDS